MRGRDLHLKRATSRSTKRASRPSGPGTHSTRQHQTPAQAQPGSHTPSPPRPPGRAPPGRGGLSRRRSWPSCHVWGMKKPWSGKRGREGREGKDMGECENAERIGGSGLWLFCGLGLWFRRWGPERRACAGLQGCLRWGRLLLSPDGGPRELKGR